MTLANANNTLIAKHDLWSVINRVSTELHKFHFCNAAAVYLSSLVWLQVLDLEAMGTRHWRIVACSAVTGAGLIDGFDWVVSDIKSRIALLD